MFVGIGVLQVCDKFYSNISVIQALTLLYPITLLLLLVLLSNFNVSCVYFVVRIAGHHQLADRLIECQYELSDKLSFFLCKRKPQHNNGEHFLIPKHDKPFSPPAQSASDALNKLKEVCVYLYYICYCCTMCV